LRPWVLRTMPPTISDTAWHFPVTRSLADCRLKNRGQCVYLQNGVFIKL
jgi:hypothetical protein